MTKTTLSTSTWWWWHPCSRVDVVRGHKSQPQPLHGREDALCVNMSHGLYQALREVARKLIPSFHHPLIMEGIVPTSNKASES